ncbi:hypothetical protein ACOME3_000212 [Neoechinorhynchus agilis]
MIFKTDFVYLLEDQNLAFRRITIKRCTSSERFETVRFMAKTYKNGSQRMSNKPCIQQEASLFTYIQNCKFSSHFKSKMINESSMWPAIVFPPLIAITLMVVLALCAWRYNANLIRSGRLPFYSNWYPYRNPSQTVVIQVSPTDMPRTNPQDVELRDEPPPPYYTLQKPDPRNEAM